MTLDPASSCEVCQGDAQQSRSGGSAQSGCALLVVSCDRYADLWRPFFSLFRRFWPDCPFPLYLLSNARVFERPGVTGVLCGPDVSWSDSLRKALDQIPYKYVFLWLDDLFLISPADTRRIRSLVEWLEQMDGNYLRLSKRPFPTEAIDRDVGIVRPGAIYRASTVLSIWKKRVLLDLLRPGETAWEFEVLGSVRSDGWGGFYAAWPQELAVVNTVIKGKWERGALRAVRALGIEPDLGRRPVMSRGESVVFGLKRMRTRVLEMLPAGSRRRVKDFVLGGRYRYGVRA